MFFLLQLVIDNITDNIVDNITDNIIDNITDTISTENLIYTILSTPTYPFYKSTLISLTLFSSQSTFFQT